MAFVIPQFTCKEFLRITSALQKPKRKQKQKYKKRRHRSRRIMAIVPPRPVSQAPLEAIPVTWSFNTNAQRNQGKGLIWINEVVLYYEFFCQLEEQYKRYEFAISSFTNMNRNESGVMLNNGVKILTFTFSNIDIATQFFQSLQAVRVFGDAINANQSSSSDSKSSSEIKIRETHLSDTTTADDDSVSSSSTVDSPDNKQHVFLVKEPQSEDVVNVTPEQDVQIINQGGAESPVLELHEDQDNVQSVYSMTIPGPVLTPSLLQIRNNGEEPSSRKRKAAEQGNEDNQENEEIRRKKRFTCVVF